MQVIFYLSSLQHADAGFMLIIQYIFGGVPRTSGRAFRYYSGTKAMLRWPHRGNRFNPSPEKQLPVTGSWLPVC